MHWMTLLTSAGSGTGVGAAGVAMLKRAFIGSVRSTVREEVKEGVKPVQDKVTALELKIARETGGNSNGLRQKVDEVSVAVAELHGAFTEHVRAGGP